MVTSTRGEQGEGQDAEGGPLAGLRGAGPAQRFCAWHGASGHRYVASIFPLDRTKDCVGLPAFEAFVLIAVALDRGRRYIVDVTAVERTEDRIPALRRGLAGGAREWHVHLLGADRAARERAVADLGRRHGAFETQARCA